MKDLLETGWARFAFDPSVAAWAEAAFTVAKERVNAPEEQRWLYCEGTWFVGVDTLPNAPDGAVGGSGPLTGQAWEAMSALYGRLPLHRGQVSVMYPGYPRPKDGEGDAAFGYRLRRDAAHVDGLLLEGPDRRRYLKERHAFILGLPLTTCNAGASPLSVWEGSHNVMRATFSEALDGVAPEAWDEVDLTEIYKAARRRVFDTCKRRLLPARPGEAYVVHRLAVHGVAPWEDGAEAPEEGRMIVYFRPEWPDPGDQWLTAP
ncbi:hypothetical protein XM53_12185 [Roseovarius atlanticus]|uniref:Phytanoyl-CoA dioxygenase n=1 Tax=Roseovarius atlanticus TaxID=1641875 RepID=A0A0T5NUF3_9RHOB|nr:hypothetical protein [Roseovarius atlanticus]KRS12382.1 hypothetical protein XM53_12185 [Roseovarius atlanticus]